MIKRYVILFAIVATTYASPVLAGDEYPTTGMVYNTKEDSAITYNCTKMHTGALECEFVQTAVRKKTKASDWSKKLAEAKKQMPDAIKDIEKDKVCVWLGSTVQVLEGKLTPEQAADTAPKGAISDKKAFIKGMKEMSDSKKQEMHDTMSALDEFCKTKSEESYLKIAKLEHDKEMRTCTVGSNPFKQKFKWVADYAGKGAWVVDAQPSGPCGIVQLDRFEADKSDSKLVFWKYIAKKAITNPKGELFLPGMTCADLDQNEYPYDWKNERDNKLGCEYIEFSPF